MPTDKLLHLLSGSTIAALVNPIGILWASAKVLLAENTETIKQIKTDTADMLEVFESWKGAMRVMEMIGKLAKPLGYIVGLALDLIVNTVVASLLFLEHPKEWTVSARLTRHSEGRGWRKRVAIAIRTALLDNIDPNGVHRG